MKRASFLRNIATIGLGGLIPLRVRAARAKQQKLYLLQCFVAGFQYYEGKDVFDKLKPGCILQARREYDNPVDKKAIALYYNEVKIGFIPARFNRTISKLLDTGVTDLMVDITHVEPRVADWEKIYVAVYTIRTTEVSLPKESEYLTKLKEPVYTTLKRATDNKGGLDWHDTLIQQSRTDHIYTLIYGDLYPYFGGIHHDFDFVAVNKAELPEKLNGSHIYNDMSNHMTLRGIAFDNKALCLLKSNKLTEYLEAAKGMREIHDNSGRNFIELIF